MKLIQITQSATPYTKSVKRTCDARCYNGTGSECNCICGGKNHGVGRERALENTAVLMGKWTHTHPEIALWVHPAVRYVQLPLPL